jgi:small subunit ribosomal protein S20
LAHSRSALKRWRQSIERRDRNRSTKSHTRTLFSKALLLIASDPTTAEPAVRAAISALDVAAQKRVIHPNAAARSKSRLLKRFNLAQAGAVAAAAATAATAAETTPAPKRRSRAAASEPKAAPKRAAKEKPKADAEKAPRARRSKS